MLIIIVTMVLFVMFVSGLTIELPLLVGALMLQILIVIAMVNIVVSTFMVNLCNYWFFMLTDDFVDRLADVMNFLFRHTVN